MLVKYRIQTDTMTSQHLRPLYGINKVVLKQLTVYPVGRDYAVHKIMYRKCYFWVNVSAALLTSQQLCKLLCNNFGAYFFFLSELIHGCVLLLKYLFSLQMFYVFSRVNYNSITLRYHQISLSF